MHFLGSCRNCILFIFTLSINISYIDSLGEILPGYKNCVIINNKMIFNTSKINNETAGILIKDRKSNSTEKFPEAAKDLTFLVNGSYPTIKWWTDPRVTQGLDHLRHILLQIVQEYVTDNGTFRETEHSLLNITGMEYTASTAVYSYNCTKFRPGAYRMEAVLWFLGKLEHTADGHLVAHVNDKSRSRTKVLGQEDIIPALRKEKDEAEDCICLSTVTIRLRALQPEGRLSTRIQADNIPDDTNVEIQVIRNDSTAKHLVRSINVLGKEIQTPYLEKFNISRGKHYYIRVIRHCKKGFYVSCGKEEADVIRSDSVFLDSGLSHSPHSSSKDDQEDKDTSKNTKHDNDHRKTAQRFVTRPTEIPKQVFQLAFIIFTFGICILAELAFIIRLMTALCCQQSTSTRYSKQVAYAMLDNRGKAITKLVRRKRIAIIFTKDSKQHEKRVYRISNELRNREIETVPFDEKFSTEMRTNWIQAAENVVKEFEVIMFVISPLLYNVCKKEETRPSLMKEESNSNTGILNKFPAVVLDALKNRDAWAGTKKARIISVCIAETKPDCKQLTLKMRREHPLVFKGKIHFDSLQQKHETRNKKSFQKFMKKLISSY